MERSEEHVGMHGLASEPERQRRDEAHVPSETDTAAEAREGGPGGGAAPESDSPLLAADERAGFRRRWDEVQTAFVDEPRRAVEEADSLVSAVMQGVADGFAREREHLEGQWGRGEEVSTEDLRVALQRYRSFFRRLLSA